VMAVGRIILPTERLVEPGIRFRQDLEAQGIPTERGLVEAPNFGTAANVSIRRERYLQLGRFDPALDGIEDQDFAMRHTAAGGKIAYLPEASPSTTMTGSIFSVSADARKGEWSGRWHSADGIRFGKTASLD